MSSSTASASVSCPSSVSAGRRTTIRSSHGYSVVNDSAADVIFNVEAVLSDDQGNRATNSAYNQLVGPNGYESGDLPTVLNVSYVSSGVVNVTATTRISGPIPANGYGNCSFFVSPQ